MKNSINQRNKINRKSSRKNTIKYIPLALAISLGMISCDKDDELAPIIKLKQSSISLENGGSITPSDYFIVSDDEDPNPTILVDINDKAISYDQAYTFLQSGDFDMNCEARDMSGNMSSAKIKVNVGVGLPQLSGLENLQENINPKIDQELNLLTGIQATDIKDGDITDNIQVYIKNINQQREEINNPTQYIVDYPGTIELKYQIQDTDNNNIEEIKTLDIQPKTWENINIPQMNIRPTDPAFSEENVNIAQCGDRRFEYLETLKIYEIWAMSEVIMKNGIGNMSNNEYLNKINNWQIISSGLGPNNDIDIEGQYTNKDKGSSHDQIVTQILAGKKNNSRAGTGIIGPIIQYGANPIERVQRDQNGPYISKREDLYERIQEKYFDKQPNKKIIIFNVYAAPREKIKEDDKSVISIRKLLDSKKCIIFAGSTNCVIDNTKNITETKVRKEGYCDNDIKGNYDLPVSITGVQSVGGCKDQNFEVNIKETYRKDNSSKSRLVIGNPKDIRYTPANHVFEEDGKIYSDRAGASSYATPSFTGLAYLVMMTNPGMTTDELLTKLNEYKKDVPVNYHIDPSQSYMSKTVDPSKAFAELIATVPTEISLSSPDLIPITRNGYKFSIPHGDGIVKTDGTPLSQDEIDNISTRGNLTQEEFLINPDELRKLGYQEGDTLTISVSVCSDSENNYEQIRDKTYDIKLLP